jgi:hypothetical protein
MKLREHSQARERVHSVTRPRFIERKKLQTLRPIKLREYSLSREKVHSVRCPRLIKMEKVVDAKTDEAEGILTG